MKIYFLLPSQSGDEDWWRQFCSIQPFREQSFFYLLTLSVLELQSPLLNLLYPAGDRWKRHLSLQLTLHLQGLNQRSLNCT